jgi:hypothetical protein
MLCYISESHMLRRDQSLKTLDGESLLGARTSKLFVAFLRLTCSSNLDLIVCLRPKMFPYVTVSHMVFEIKLSHSKLLKVKGGRF